MKKTAIRKYPKSIEGNGPEICTWRYDVGRMKELLEAQDYLKTRREEVREMVQKAIDKEAETDTNRVITDYERKIKGEAQRKIEHLVEGYQEILLPSELTDKEKGLIKSGVRRKIERKYAGGIDLHTTSQSEKVYRLRASFIFPFNALLINSPRYTRKARVKRENGDGIIAEFKNKDGHTFYITDRITLWTEQSIDEWLLFNLYSVYRIDPETLIDRYLFEVSGKKVKAVPGTVEWTTGIMQVAKLEIKGG